jgi:lysophospholipase L1-like esterase
MSRSIPFGRSFAPSSGGHSTPSALGSEGNVRPTVPLKNPIHPWVPHMVALTGLCTTAALFSPAIAFSQPSQPSPAAISPSTVEKPDTTRAVRGGPRTPAPQSVCPRDAEPWTPSDFNSLKPGLPTLIIAGDSTADKGPDAWHRGWAAVINDYFDGTKINLVNRARGGRSFRSFVREGLWDQLLAGVKSGDIVMIQFGHNDGGDINSPNGRPDLPGIGEETQTVKRPDGTDEIVHTFGWYARKFVRDVRAKGAQPVLMSTTVYNRWTDGHHSNRPGKMFDWAHQVADEEKIPILDHGAIISARYEQLGEAAVKPFFPADGLHTSTPGAEVNAEAFVAGVRTLALSPLVAALTAKGAAVTAWQPALKPTPESIAK